MSGSREILILGGGIGGLAAAQRVARAGVTLTILEGRSRAGGCLATCRQGPYVFETGPNTIQRSTPEVERLLTELALVDEVIEAADSAAKRYVVRDGQLLATPSGPADIFRTRMLSWKARARLLREPFVAAASEDESVSDFVMRRLGREFLDYAIDPFVAGVHAGDPDRLSIRHAFPRMHALEQAYGSLIKGALSPSRRRNQYRPRWSMFSLGSGLSRLPERIVEEPNIDIRFETIVERVSRERDGRWMVRTSRETHRADAIVWTLPLHEGASAQLLAGEQRIALPKIQYAPVVVVTAVYRANDVRHTLDGFGMLVPSAEAALRILGTLFTSSIFPSRVPPGEVLLTTFLGGMRHPDHARLNDDELIELAHRDNARLLGIRATPTTAHVARWPFAIPQYELGYDRILNSLTAIEREHPGIFFAGNYRRGISVPDTVTSGFAAADALSTFLKHG